MQDSHDQVQSYFGMRKISLGQVPGELNPRILLNNLFVFQMGVLDQVGNSLCITSNWSVMYALHPEAKSVQWVVKAHLVAGRMV